MDRDLDDSHLCIKCNLIIVGLDNYIQHRKLNCSTSTTTADTATSSHTQPTKVTTSAATVSTATIAATTAATKRTRRTTVQQQQSAVAPPAITYEPFSFNEPEAETDPPNPASHGGKTSKALTESYELPYELDADVFFSFLQLQSVQSSVGHHVPPATGGGKTGASQQTEPPIRQKSIQQETAVTTTAESWINNETPRQSRSEHFLKDVNDIGESKKSYGTIFKTGTFATESPEATEEEEEEEEMDADVIDEDDDDDEDYDPMNEAHGGRGKWKLSIMRNSPPVVPVSHTGGKWKPEHRPNLSVAHSQIPRVSPAWDDNMEDADGHEDHHPPSEHTKGKWIPGTKLQKLEYKEEVELAKCSSANQDYWCNICCRKLKSKSIYENHLKTLYHLKRAEPERQLEKAVIKKVPKDDANKQLLVVEFKPLTNKLSTNSGKSKRQRRSTYLKCSLCKHIVARHLRGKHLISHYHYRRMQLYPIISQPMILDNIHAIVLQSPFQCRPCRFYANTEENFLLHWSSASHLDASEGPGHFWCFYCQFECEDNNQMRRHLLSAQHKEVLLAINRSVPVCISKRLSMDCPKCGQTFRSNFALRHHITYYHRGMELTGTASDAYQSKYRCDCCTEVLCSKIALQRHEKFKHSINKYFCWICNIAFDSPCQARRHRKSLEHKQKALSANEKYKLVGSYPLKKEEDDKPSTSNQAVTFSCNECSFTTSLKEEFTLHGQREHIGSQHNCILCSENFASAQELGRHTRSCKPAVVATPEEVKLAIQIKEVTNEQGEKIWLCELCDFKAPFRSEILYHRIFHSYGSVGKNQQLPCPLCDKRFRKQSLRFHLHNHTKEKLFKCQICGNSFSRPYNLKDHIKNIHGDEGSKSAEGPATDAKGAQTSVSAAVKSFPCNSCEKVFKSKHSMKMHHLTHHASQSTLTENQHRLFECTHENCKYVSVNKSLLSIHLNSHSMESFNCTKEGCSYVGKSKLHLKRHLRSHISSIEAKKFICRECGFKTKVKGHLQRHMRVHTGEKPFSCPHCNFCCTTWENLRKHILKTDKHDGKFVFECEKCKEQFARKRVKHEKKINKIFKTNSYQEYQQHLKSEHSKTCH